VALVPARAVSPGRPTERASPVPDASRRTSSPHSRSLDGATLGWHRVSRSRQNGVDMSRIRAGRYTADLSDLDDEVVVFLIGMRVNRPWRVTEWWPVFTAMPRMLRYLQQHPDKGLLGVPTVIPALAASDSVLAVVRRSGAVRPGPQRPPPGAVAAVQPARRRFRRRRHLA
jgi:hypothetical protein